MNWAISSFQESESIHPQNSSHSADHNKGLTQCSHNILKGLYWLCCTPCSSKDVPKPPPTKANASLNLFFQNMSHHFHSICKEFTFHSISKRNLKEFQKESTKPQDITWHEGPQKETIPAPPEWGISLYSKHISVNWRPQTAVYSDYNISVLQQP